MAIEIARDLKEIKEELTSTNAALKESAKNAASLQRSLKLDPSNATLVKASYSELQNQIGLCQKKISLLREEQAKMVAANGPDAKLTPQYQRLEVQIAQVEAQGKKLNAELKTTSKIDLSALKKGFSTILKTAAGITAAIIGIGVAYAKTADEIDKSIAKFGGTAEAWQYAANQWDQMTGDASAYETVLSAVTSVQGQVQKESSKTGKVLEMLGLTFDDLKGKSSTEALQIYMAALAQIGDEATRQSIAVALFGETAGIYIANMCSTGAGEIEEWNDALREAGILTSEEVATGAALQDTFDYLKQTIIKLVATVGKNLTPTIEVFVNLIKSGANLVGMLSQALIGIGPAGTIALGVFISMIAALPSLIMMLNAFNVSTGNMVLAALGYAALAAATGIAIGFMAGNGGHSSDTNQYVNQANGGGILQEGSDIASANSDSAASTTNNTTNETKSYSDNSTNNYYISSETDVDAVIEEITNRRRALVGGN